jgi:hypothetical protein
VSSRDECSAFGPSASDDAFDVGFPLPHQRTLVSQHEGTRATRLHIARPQSHVSEQSKQFSGVLCLIVVKLQVNYSQYRIGVMNKLNNNYMH